MAGRSTRAIQSTDGVSDIAACLIARATQWYRARWSVGVVRLVAPGSGGEPICVGDVVDALRQRERDGLVVLAPAPGLRRGDPVRIARGIFTGELALYDGMRPHERVGMLLRVLGRVELPAGDVVPL
jgi:hypothetical protein